MPLLQVRNISDKLYGKLKEAAVNDKRSIAQETLTLIQDALEKNDNHIARRRSILNRINTLDQLKWPEDSPDPTDIIRMDRER